MKGHEHTLISQSFFGEKQAGVPADRRKMFIKVSTIIFFNGGCRVLDILSANLFFTATQVHIKARSSCITV